MKQFFLLLSIAICFTLNTQAQDIKFDQKKVGDQKIIVCTNSSDKDFEVIFTYTSSGYKVNATSPIKQVIKAFSIQDIATFTAIKGQPTSIQMNYNYKEIRKNKPTKSMAYNFDGITVFGKKSCSRCTYFADDLKKNNVKFKELDIKANPDHNALMWEKLYAAGFKGSRISTPVVIVDNKVYYNIENLTALLAQLKAKY